MMFYENHANVFMKIFSLNIFIKITSNFFLSILFITLLGFLFYE